jgi:HPt (histidine-containing phosphotransfer) domain-containing protein
MIAQEDSSDANSGANKTLIRPPDGLPHSVVATYLENCRRSLQPLKTAIEGDDYEFIRVYGHRMKGCGAAYGFPPLTAAGASMEKAAFGRNKEELRDCVVVLEAYLRSVEVEDP